MTIKSDIDTIWRLREKCAYNLPNKEKYRKAAMRFLKALDFELGGGGDVRYHPAGIACSGDSTLHRDNVYVQFNLDWMCNDLGILVRHCESKKDYTGRRNCWFQFEKLKTEGFESLVRFVNSIEAPLFAVYPEDNKGCQVKPFTQEEQHGQA